MPTECSAKPIGFAPVDGRAVVAEFDGGEITSDAGALLLGATDRAIGLVERFAACFADGRAPERVVHEVATLVGQRVFGIALGYEDLVDHDQLRHDPVLAAVLGRLEARHGRCAPLAGKSTLNRLEHGARGADRYRRIAHDGAAIEALFVDLFLEAHARAAGGDRARPRRHRRPAPRPPGRALLPRLLRLLLLPAALHLLRPPSAGGEAPALEHRRLGRRGRGGGAHRRPDPRPLAAGADRAARRRRLRPRGADGLVRGQRRRLPVRPGAQRPAGRAHRRRARLGRARRRGDRPPRPPLRRLPLDDARQLEPPAPGGRQGRAPGPAKGAPTRASSSPRSRPPGRTPARSTRRSTAPAARWRTGSRSGSSTCSPTAPAPRRCAPTSSGCGSRRSPTCSWRRCGGSASPAPSSPPPPAAPSG